jgi:hypothetical protein
MHTFGSTCFGYVQEKKKLDPRSEKGVFVGYDVSSPAYLMYFPDKDTIRRVRCVKFNDKLPKPEATAQEDNSPEYLRRRSTEQHENIDESPATSDSESETEHIDQPPENPNNYVQVEAANIGGTRENPKRQRKPPKYLDDYDVDLDHLDAASCNIDYCYRVSDIPKSYDEAVTSNEAGKWKKAMDEEMTSLIDNNTYDLTPVPADRSVVGGRWVYAVKLGPDNEEKFKARYVAKGYSQIENVDYKETFSPTARITSVRMLMQLAIQNGYLIDQMDVKTAYLNANIDCELFVEQPEGYIKTDKTGNRLVCKLNKSLYGLKQSGRNWNNVLHNFLLSLNFQQSLNDHCVYTKHENDLCIILIVWVDDLIICANDKIAIDNIKHAMCQKFKMKDLGKLSWFLGIEFQLENYSIKMNQTRDLKRILTRFRMDDCHPKSIPCDLSINKEFHSDSKELTDSRLYREIVGSLIYVMTCTRPDLSYVVTKLSQHMSKPTIAHLNLSKFVLKYIKGTLDYNLKFKKCNNDLNLMGFCDSDWGGSTDRKSISGYCFQLNNDGPLLSWKSKKQNTVALSSCEAEYMALTHAIQEANFLQQLLKDMQGSNDKLPVHLNVDNQGAIELAKNPVHHQRSKHIDIKYHYIRSQVLDNTVILHYVPTNDNVADMFTKPVSKIKLNKFQVIRG